MVLIVTNLIINVSIVMKLGKLMKFTFYLEFTKINSGFNFILFYAKIIKPGVKVTIEMHSILVWMVPMTQAE